jgi:hypothetical protein
VEAEWTVVARCDRAGSGGADGSDAGTDGGCMPVALAHAREAEGCVPDLQHPDCPADALETCGDAACSTGCIDFFLCTEDGWTVVAYCTEQGQVIVTQ